MSLKDRLEAIKSESEDKKSIEKIKGEKENLKEIVSRKEELSNKINDLKSLVQNLKISYSQAGKNLENVKQNKENIKSLYTQYEPYLKEQGINSIGELLKSDDFQDEEDIVKYHEASASKLEKTGERGSLGKEIEEISTLKAKAKESLPETKLDFRGKKRDEEEMSPRESSILKIEEYITSLEKELHEIEIEKSQQASELMPKIKETLETDIEKIFKSGYGLSPKAGNIIFISDEILELGGDELWPEIEKEAENLIAKYYTNYNHEEINQSLEAEKMIFDVEKIRNEHQDLLDLYNDKKKIEQISNKLEKNGFLQDYRKMFIKNGNIYEGHLVEQAQYFEEKNIEAKKVIESVINQSLTSLTNLKNKMPSSFMSSKRRKEDIERINSALNEAIEEMKKIKAPENFFCDDLYNFSNKFLGSFPNNIDVYSGKKDLIEIHNEIIKKNNEARDAINNLRAKESETVRKFSDDLYQARRGDKKTTPMGGYNIPYLAIEDLNNDHGIKDDEAIETAFSQANNVIIEKEEAIKLLNEKVGEFTRNIDEYPSSSTILESFKKLEDKFDKEYQRDANLVHEKVSTKQGKKSYNIKHKSNYQIKADLFYN